MNPIISIVFLAICVTVFGVSIYRLVKRRKLARAAKYNAEQKS